MTTVCRLRELLAQEIQLHEKLVNTDIAGDGLFNEITGGRLTVTGDLPDTSRLTEMRTTWIPEVEERMEKILKDGRDCAVRDRELHKKKLTLTNTTALNSKDIEIIAFYNPGLADTIIKTDQCAQRLIGKIEEIHAQNAPLVERLEHRKQTFTSSMEIDKWQYAINSCRGTTPSARQWFLSPVKVGGFVSKLEEKIATSPPMWDEISIGSSEEITPYAPSGEIKTFPLLTEELRGIFQEIFPIAKTAGKQDLCTHLGSLIQVMKFRIENIESLMGNRMEPTLKGEFSSAILEMQAKLTEAAFNTHVDKFSDIKKRYETILSELTPPSFFSEPTLKRLSYLNPKLKEETENVLLTWKRSFRELKTNWKWLETVNLDSLEDLKDKLSNLASHFGSK